MVDGLSVNALAAIIFGAPLATNFHVKLKIE